MGKKKAAELVSEYRDFRLEVSEGTNQRFRWSIRRAGEFFCSGHPTGWTEKQEAVDTGNIVFKALRAHEKVEHAKHLVEKATRQVTASEKALEREKALTAKRGQDLDRARSQRNGIAALTVIAFVVAVIAITSGT